MMPNISTKCHGDPLSGFCVKLSTTFPNTNMHFGYPLDLWPQPLPRVTTALYHVSYHRMRNWILNILVLVLSHSDSHSHPQPLTRVMTSLCHVVYHKIGHWILNILVLVLSHSDNNWPRYDENKILTFSWPWPLIGLLPKASPGVLG